MQGLVQNLASDPSSFLSSSARGSFFLVVGNVASAIIQAIGVFVVARLLGPEVYGIYTLSLVVPTILFQIADFGVSQGIIKFSASLSVKGERGRIATLIRNGFLFKLSVGLLALCFAVFSSEWLASAVVNRVELASYIRLCSISIILLAISDAVTSAFIGLDRMEYSALIMDVQAAAKALLSITLVILGFGLTGAVLGYVAGGLASALLGSFLLYLKIYKPLNDDGNANLGFRESIRTLVGYGFPIYLSILLVGFIPQIQSIILSIYASNYEIGNFRAAANFITLLSLLITPIATALFPAFSKLDMDNAEAGRFFSLSIKYVTLILVPAATAAIIFSKPINQLVYGSEYSLAPTYLALYSLIFLLAGFGYQVLNSLFNGANETFTTLKMGLITLSTFILLAPPLTMKFSVQGLITATIICNFAATIYGAKKAKDKFKVQYPWKSLMLIYLTAAISAAPALLTLKLMPTQSTIVEFAAAATIYILSYITLLPIIKAINQHEIEEIRTATRKIPIVKPLITLLLKYETKIASMKAQNRI